MAGGTGFEVRNSYKLCEFIYEGDMKEREQRNLRKRKISTPVEPKQTKLSFPTLSKPEMKKRTNPVDSPSASTPLTAMDPFPTKTPKKLIMKSLKTKPKVSETYISDTIEKLCNSVTAIHTQTTVPDSLEELYKACENICHYGKSSELHLNLLELFKKQVDHEKKTLEQ
jgi:hypothetical protein